MPVMHNMITKSKRDMNQIFDKHWDYHDPFDEP
jgi:hypothetical protein